MIRIYVFYISTSVISIKPALVHEAMDIILVDCFYFQVDYIIEDTNMTDYRTDDSKLGSFIIRDLPGDGQILSQDL